MPSLKFANKDAATKSFQLNGIEIATVTDAGIAIPAGKKLYLPGEVIQQVVGYAAGTTGTTSTSFVNIGGSLVTITPRSTNSKLVLQCAFTGRSNAVGGINAQGQFQLTEVTGAATAVAPMTRIAVDTSAGGSGIFAPSSQISNLLSNTALTARSFSLFISTNNVSVSVGATDVSIIATEIQA